MRIKSLLFLAFLLLGGVAFAQREANNWFFGDKAGLTWNTTRSGYAYGVTTTDAVLEGLPSVIGSAIRTDAGCFALSTNEGRVLFYSDGERIWDRNNLIMPNGNGLQGNFSSAQSGIILPYPGQPNKFINVSIGAGAANHAPYYSVIDMALPGNGTVANPAGNVIVGQKNIPFTGASGITNESVTSILHANGVDYWIVAPGRGNPIYLNAWLVTASGPQTSSPVITTMALSIPTGNSSGYIKFTADGKHFAWADDTDTVVFGDFNSTTGQFSNLKYIKYASNAADEPYGIEFSPSMQYLYVGGREKIFVYDLDVLLNWPSVNATAAPRKLFNVGVEVNALQLAPDGRIYFTAYNLTTLFVITNPNEYDNLKIYELQHDFLGRGISKIGLPSFAASWFKVEPNVASFSCAGNPTKISVSIDASAGLTSRLEWNFGDGSPVVSQNFVNGVSTYQQTHEYANQGIYSVTVTPYRANGTSMDKVTFNVNIVECTVRTNRMIRTDLLNSNVINSK